MGWRRGLPGGSRRSVCFRGAGKATPVVCVVAVDQLMSPHLGPHREPAARIELSGWNSELDDLGRVDVDRPVEVRGLIERGSREVRCGCPKLGVCDGLGNYAPGKELDGSRNSRDLTEVREGDEDDALPGRIDFLFANLDPCPASSTSQHRIDSALLLPARFLLPHQPATGFRRERRWGDESAWPPEPSCCVY